MVLLPVRHWPRELLAGLLDLVLPALCAGCGAGADRGGRSGALCRDCATALESPPFRVPGRLEVTAAAVYDGAARSLLLAHKERGQCSLAQPLGLALARAVTAVGRAPPYLLVPVPSSSAATRARGHDPTARIALAAAAALRSSGYDASRLAVLRQRHGVLDQAGLSAAQRAANMAGAVTVPRRLHRLVAGRRLVIVDDIVTTGASLLAARAALRAAGGHVTGCAVVAATRPALSDAWRSR
jgi:predicted amidophosphoribosyltransferase